MSKLACVFPGQGSQQQGMLSDMYHNFPSVVNAFQEASDALSLDLWDICQNDKTKLNQTEITQPALLTASVACLNVLQIETEFKPDFMAGHSLGEYTALVAGNVIDLATGVKLVNARGKYMQQAVKPGDGAMFAIIGLDDDKIAEICAGIQAQLNQVVAPVNYNSPGQVVIAGTSEAAELAAQKIKVAGAKRALPLAVSVPSHCELMKEASEQLAELLSTLPFDSPTVSIVNNVDVKVESNADAIKDALVRQLYMPVRWTETVQYLSTQGVSKIVEVGPGKVLTGLIKRIDKSIELSNVSTPSDI